MKMDSIPSNNAALRKFSLSLAVIPLLALTACGGGTDPLTGESDDSDGTSDSGAVVIGSQQYYSNTIIAEIYAQVLEAEGYEIDRQFEIGQREVYLPELESGDIDLFPEYTGNLLQYFDSEADGGNPDDVYSTLQDSLPEGLDALDYAAATDQDSYVVTSEFAAEHGLSTVGDLAGVDQDLTIASNSEFETRPYGPSGLLEVYGVEITLIPVEDSGGPLTLNALLSGDTQVANLYSADPAIEENDLVILEDTESLVLPQNVVPIASANIDDDARDIINSVQALLTQDELLALNSYSQTEQASPADVASWWLEEQGLLS